MLLHAKRRLARRGCLPFIGCPSGRRQRALTLSRNIARSACITLALCCGIVNREHQLDALVEVARHPVGAGEVDLLLAAVQEIVDARVLEKTIDDRDHLDVLAVPGHAGPQRADAAHVQADATPARDAA